MTSPRIVVVSNRVPPPPADDRPWPAGGLVSALMPALIARGNAMWFGWSGETGDPVAAPTTVSAEGVEFVTLDLNESQLDNYYAGFCNGVLWPALHSLEHEDADDDSFVTYLSVNRLFAARLLPRLRPDDLIWIHDYHLLALGSELRKMGWHGPIGYFHHVPVPDVDRWSHIPHAEMITGWLHAYDRIGVQTSADAVRLSAVVAPGAARRIGVYPAGIDPKRFRGLADDFPENPLHRAHDHRQVIVGVDRLDYTKGILERLEAFEHVLDEDPSLAERVRFVQWAAPSRERVAEYRAYRSRVEATAARINARHGALRPVQLDISVHEPAEVAAALRSADICLVTSLADGMNLVAKEFAAVRSEEHPGVLILSDACGASEQLSDALIVRSTEVRSIADAIRRAIDMPADQRRSRSRSLRRIVDVYTTHMWLSRFVADLAEGRAAEPDARPFLVAS